jgi:hypothetical protein
MYVYMYVYWGRLGNNIGYRRLNTTELNRPSDTGIQGPTIRRRTQDRTHIAETAEPQDGRINLDESNRER